MVKLTKPEKDQIVKLSSEFVSIHKEILAVEKTIKNMQERAERLLEGLEECRRKEKAFHSHLQEKYGEGFLDPINLEWKKEEFVYEIHK